MYKASASVLLPTSIISSLPRPAWHTVQLGSRSICSLNAAVKVLWALGRARHPQGPRENNKAEHPLLPAVTA